MKKFRVRVKDDSQGRQEIAIEIWDKEYNQYGLMKGYPVENFTKNKDLAQMFINELASLPIDDTEFVIKKIEALE